MTVEYQLNFDDSGFYTRKMSSLTNSYELTNLDAESQYSVWVNVDTVDYGQSELNDEAIFSTIASSASELSLFETLEALYNTNEAYAATLMSDLTSYMNTDIWGTLDTEITSLDSATDCTSTFDDTSYLASLSSIASGLTDVEKRGSVWFDAYRTSDFGPPASQWDAVTYDGLRSSDSSIFDLTTGTFIAPMDGNYEFIFQAASGRSNTKLNLYVDDTSGLYASGFDQDDSNSVTVTFQTILELSMNSVVYVGLKENSCLSDSNDVAIHFTGRLISTF